MEEESKKEEPDVEGEREELAEASEEATVEETAEEAVEEEKDEIVEEAREEVEKEGIVGEKGEEVSEEVGEEEKVGETVEGEEETPTPAEEEAKPEKEEKVEEEIVEERVYTIPLGKAWISPPRKRAPRAMRIIKSFVTRHMKLEARREGEEEEEPKRLVVDNGVNEVVWGGGVERPPRKVRVRVAKDKEGNVTVYLAEGD